MSTAMVAEVEAVTASPDSSPDAQLEPSQRRRRRDEPPLFNDAQQSVLNREIGKAKRRAKGEFEAERSALRRDVKELLWACEQLLFKRLTPQQRQDFAGVVIEMRREYGPEQETECQKT